MIFHITSDVLLIELLQDFRCPLFTRFEVHREVVPQFGYQSERLIADIAPVRFVPQMAPTVSEQVSRLPERTIAVGAFVWLLAGVGSHVPFEDA